MSIRVSIPAVALAMACALALSGCGSAGPADSAAAVLSRGALASLTNYRARLTSGMGKYHMTIRTQVHSAVNWAAESGGLTVLHIGPMSYVHSGKQWRQHPRQPNDYAQSNLPSFARQFYSMTRLSDVRVRRGGPCRQAGLPGRTWTIRASRGSTFGETFTACVADGSGALLKLIVAAPDTGLADRYASEVYEITAVGNVPPFRAPAHVTGH